MTCAAIVINFFGASNTQRCLDSLSSAGQLDAVIVVDNGCADFAEDRALAPWHHLTPHYVPLATNLGFGGAANVGLSFARELGMEQGWLLNNDAVATEGCLANLQKTMAATNAAVVSPQINRIEEPTRVWYRGGDYDRTRAKVHHRYDGVCAPPGGPAELVTFVTGCAPLVDLRALEEVGDFDPTYFMYWEDVDLCERLRRAGKKLLVDPSSLVLHSEGSSGIKSGERSSLFYRHDTCNRARMIRLNHSGWTSLTARLYTPIHLARSIWRVAFRERTQRVEKLWAIVLSSADVIRRRP